MKIIGTKDSTDFSHEDKDLCWYLDLNQIDWLYNAKGPALSGTNSSYWERDYEKKRPRIWVHLGLGNLSKRKTIISFIHNEFFLSSLLVDICQRLNHVYQCVLWIMYWLWNWISSETLLDLGFITTKCY